MASLDPRACYRALQARDPRFDGRIFVAVRTTGIYCRPVCPASPARFENCRFFPSAAAAQDAGFRPCLRCRPETTYELGAWRGTSNTVARALTLITEGALDEDEGNVEALAERVGVGERQLRRLFQRHLGASPVAVATTRRVLFAKHLLHETRLPMTEVAAAAGFGSVRRFNEAFRDLFGCSPTSLRRGAASSLPPGSAAHAGVTVLLRYRPPYDWAAMLAHLSARAIRDVERVRDGRWSRVVVEGSAVGAVEVRPAPKDHALVATIRFPEVALLPKIVARVRRLFDLDTEIDAIEAHLKRDPRLRPLVAARPGLRVPGAWDGFELAVRAVLGQQVSVAAARRLLGELVALAGAEAATGDPELSRAFPTPAAVAAAAPRLRIPAARKRALVAVSEATVADPALFRARGTVEDTVAKLTAVRGVGDWTAHYVALRAAREPDAFPSTDAALVRAAAALGHARDAEELVLRAESWRPWRGYAAQHLWAADAESPARTRKTSP